MLDGWKKEDPLTMKKLPIQVDIPEYLITMVVGKYAGEGQKAIADLTLITFYYLLWVLGEYICKQKQNNVKRIVQFRSKDDTFFKQGK